MATFATPLWRRPRDERLRQAYAYLGRTVAIAVNDLRVADPAGDRTIVGAVVAVGLDYDAGRDFIVVDQFDGSYDRVIPLATVRNITTGGQQP